MSEPSQRPCSHLCSFRPAVCAVSGPLSPSVNEARHTPLRPSRGPTMLTGLFSSAPPAHSVQVSSTPDACTHSPLHPLLPMPRAFSLQPIKQLVLPFPSVSFPLRPPQSPPHPLQSDGTQLTMTRSWGWMTTAHPTIRFPPLYYLQFSTRLGNHHNLAACLSAAPAVDPEPKESHDLGSAGRLPRGQN